jgi:hypothetical protein
MPIWWHSMQPSLNPLIPAGVAFRSGRLSIDSQ